METVLKAIADWIKGILTAGIMSNLSGLFDAVNEQVGDIAQQVGTRPSAFEPRVFAMIESLSRNVVLPIAGIILTFIACYELIEMITQHNNMAQFEPALIMRWIFKTAVSVWFISNTFDIVMAVFDLTQKVVSDSSGIIAGNTRVNDIGLSMLQSSLMQMDVGPLFGLFLQSFFIGITMRILSIIIFVIVYGRMIEIYCMVSLAPIPMATWGNHEQSHMGQNYLKCLFALGFQGFLILICVAIYAVLIQSVAISGDAINSIWSIVGYCGAKLTLTSSRKWRKLSDGTLDDTLRVRYTCYGKLRKQTGCTGQTGYTVHILDEIIDKSVRQIFSKMRGIPKEQIITRRYEREVVERKNHLQTIQVERDKAQKDLISLKAEILACIKGESVFPKETLAEMITAQEEKLRELDALYESSYAETEKTAELMDNVSKLYEELISFSDLYDSASFEAKKMIVNQLIRRVDVYRGYQLNITFNFDLTPYIEGDDTTAC